MKLVTEATPHMLALVNAVSAGDMVTAMAEALKIVKILEKLPACFKETSLGECPFVCVFKHARCLRR